MRFGTECPTILGGPTVVTVDSGGIDSNELIEKILSSPEVGKCCDALKRINDSGCFCERRLVNVLGRYYDPTEYIPYFNEVATLVRDSTPYACGFFIRGGDECSEQVPDGWTGEWEAPIAIGTGKEEDEENQEESGAHESEYDSFMADFTSITRACPMITDPAATTENVLSSPEADRPRRCCFALRRVNHNEGFCGGRLDHYYEHMGPDAERVGDLVVHAAPKSCGFLIKAGDDCMEQIPDAVDFDEEEEDHDDEEEAVEEDPAGVVHAITRIATGCPAFWDDGHLTEEELSSSETRKCCSAMRRVDQSRILCRRNVDSVLSVLGSGGDYSNAHLRQYLTYFDGLADRLLSAAPRACGFFMRTGGDCMERVPEGWAEPVVRAPWQHEDSAAHLEVEKEEDEIEMVDAFDGPGGWSGFEIFYDDSSHLNCTIYHSGSDGNAISVSNRGSKSVIASSIFVPDRFEITHMAATVNITYASRSPLKIQLRAAGGPSSGKRRKADHRSETTVTMFASKRLMRPLEMLNTTFTDIDGHTDQFYDIADADSVDDAYEMGTVFSLPRAPPALKRALAKHSLNDKTIESKQSMHAFHFQGDGEETRPRLKSKSGRGKGVRVKGHARMPVAGSGGSFGRWKLVIETFDARHRLKKNMRLAQEQRLDLDAQKLAEEVLGNWSLTLCHA